MVSFFRKTINEKKNEDFVIVEKSKENIRNKLLEEHENKINFSMSLKCYDYCVKSYMEKILNPYEKECMQNCYQTLYSFYLEVHNNLIQSESK